jgi:PKHD-type hydroxylase
MQLFNNYYYFQSALSPEICQKIIDMGLAKIEEDKQKGYNPTATTFAKCDKETVIGKSHTAIPQNDLTWEQLHETGLSNEDIIKNSYIRDSQVSWLNDKWLYDTILPYSEEANRLAHWNFDTDFYEDFQFTVYRPGGFYGWHNDGGSDHYSKYKRFIPGIMDYEEKDIVPAGYSRNPNIVGKVRKLSLTINLNSPGDYDGGNLKFDFGPHADTRFYECEEIKPQGSIIVFPSFQYHQVTPVTRGTRYSLVLWQLGNPFR